MSYWAEMGLFLGKSAIVVIAVVIILVVFASLIAKSKGMAERVRLSVKDMNKRFVDMKNALRIVTMDKPEFKKMIKEESKKEKKVKKDGVVKKIFVLDFHGDIKATGAQALSQEVSVILSVAKPGDEVLIRLESQGGLVHSYGFAMAELERITRQGIRLVVAVDKVAASGGYMMACVADHIIAAPFAVIGSIGVVAQLPNLHRILKKNDIDIEQHTAGEYKRTLTILGENTEKGRAKFIEDLERTHELFKKHVKKYRQDVSVEEVATGEIWYGQEALDKKLVDENGTSAGYLCAALEEGTHAYEVKWEEKRKGWLRRLNKGVENSVLKGLDNVWERVFRNRFPGF